MGKNFIGKDRRKLITAVASIGASVVLVTITVFLLLAVIEFDTSENDDEYSNESSGFANGESNAANNGVEKDADEGEGDALKEGAQIEQLKRALDDTLDYYRQSRSEPQSWWEMVALWGAGEDLKGLEDSPVFSRLKDDVSPTDYAGVICALLALGEDPSKIWPEVDPVDELLQKQQDKGGFGGSLNNTIWAMIALNSAISDDFSSAGGGAKEASSYLLQQQLDDGGFALAGEIGDPDVTAMAIQALVPHDNLLPEIDGAVDDALSFLQEEQLQTGGFSSYGQENANSISMVISALLAAGEDPLAPEWQGEDDSTEAGKGSMLDALLQFQLKDGSFTYLLDSAQTNDMATYQALIALGDLAAGEPVMLRLMGSKG